MHCLLDIVLDNAVEEAISGECTQIEVDLNADGSVVVTDNGRGIPTDIYLKTGKVFLESIMTRLWTGGLDPYKHLYKIDGSLRGGGVTIVNALSEWLEATVWQEQKQFFQRYERGETVTTLQVTPNRENRWGTSIAFKPDPQILTATRFDSTLLAVRLHELAYLNPELQVVLRDRHLERIGRTPHIDTFYYPNGIADYLTGVNASLTLASDIFHIKTQCDRLQIEVALRWYAASEVKYRHILHSFSCTAIFGQAFGERFHPDRELYDALHITSFANQTRTIHGGTHVEGLKQGAVRAIEALHPLSGDDIQEKWRQVRSGLMGILAVMVPHPEYSDSMTYRLENREVEETIAAVVEPSLLQYLRDRTEVVDNLLYFCS
ncbi:MAG: ATP-binding protein [Cyanobacteriota bacterium]|nr:ATP-binding protein [Cyanobacteriota bacterium]